MFSLFSHSGEVNIDALSKRFLVGLKLSQNQTILRLPPFSQDEMRVECRRRVASNSDQWETETYGQEEEVFLKSIGLAVAIADLYRGVSLAEGIPSSSGST